MSRDFNLYDMLIGLGFGIVFTLLTLRLAGYVDYTVNFWVPLALFPTILLILARQRKMRPSAKDGVEAHMESKDG